MTYPFVTIKNWVDFVHHYQKELLDKSDTTPSITQCIPTLSISYRHPIPEYKKLIYKCKWGSSCFQPSCIYIHPGHKEYDNASYYKNNSYCKYETTYTSCKNKCGHIDGKYCPFTHCTHIDTKSTSCMKTRCQRHCMLCL